MNEENKVMSTNVNIDIHKLIDDAMEKKDRTVNLFISDHGTSIYVNPIREEDEPHWKYDDLGNPVCSNCGRYPVSGRMTTYCPDCGELMHGLGKENLEK